MEKKSYNEKLFHLMDGLLYPAVTGAGLVVLLIRAAAGPEQVEFAPRIALGVMTLCIYSASYVAFKDVPESGYSGTILFWDLLEVAAIFGCFLALGLLDPNSKEPVSYSVFFGLMAIDILGIQPMWRRVALNSGMHRYWFRVILIGALGVAFVPGLRVWMALLVIVLVGIYEFVLREL